MPAAHEHIDAERLAPCGSVLSTTACTYWSKLASSIVSVWSSVKFDSCLNDKTISERKAGHAPLQFIPDFFGPECHLEEAKHIVHPTTPSPLLFPPAQHAIDYQRRDCHALVQQCFSMCHALHVLAAATMDEAGKLCQHAPRPTQAVLQAGGPLRDVPYMLSR